MSGYGDLGHPAEWRTGQRVTLLWDPTGHPIEGYLRKFRLDEVERTKDWPNQAAYLEECYPTGRTLVLGENIRVGLTMLQHDVPGKSNVE